jgi:acetaldehyde dehydrogenase (acetylating)
VRVRLDVTDVQSGLLLRAAGARRFAFNWAVAKIKANADQWAYVVPPVNLEEHLDGEATNRNLVTSGGQATIPIVHAVARITPVPW